MDKENKAAQPDSLSVSTISNGAYSYEHPPPAYPSKKSTTIALARIAATTVLAAAFILGAFIVAGSYVSALAKCNCPQDSPQDLPKAASFVGVTSEDKKDVLTKPEETPSKLTEKASVNEVKVPIAVTTTEGPPDTEDDTDDTSEPVVSTEEEEEPDLPNVQEKIMELLQKMLQIDPSMRGNMKCKVSKQPHPLNPDGKPLLQVHCKKATTMQIIRPIGAPFNPLNRLRGPPMMRFPSPLTPGGILRMQKPVVLPIRRLLPQVETRILPQAEPGFGRIMPQPENRIIPFLQKPKLEGSGLPLLLKLAQLRPLRPPMEEEEEEEDVPRFPIFPQKRVFGNPDPRPKLRFVVPFKNDQEDTPFRQDFPVRDPFSRFPQPIPEEHQPIEHREEKEDEEPRPHVPIPIFHPLEEKQDEEPRPHVPIPMFRPIPPRFNFQQNVFPEPQQQEQHDDMPEKHLPPPPNFQETNNQPDFYPERINNEEEEIPEPLQPNSLPPFSSPPQYNQENEQEEETPEVPDRPIVIPIKRTEPEQPQRPEPFPFTSPLSLLERIRNLQRLPPRHLVPRTYRLNNPTISESERRGVHSGVDASKP